MRSVRCEACGTKALLAATQCPHCGHLLNVRDGFGELLPLSHCSTCNTEYVARLGKCPWCGTKASEGLSLRPFIWKGIGVVAVGGLLLAAWFANRSDDPGEGGPAVSIESRDGDVSADSAARAPSPSNVALDSSRSSDSAMAHDSLLPVEAVPSIPSDDPALVGIGAPPSPEESPAAEASRSTRTVTRPAPAARTRWVSRTSRDWVIVRSGATKSSRIVASIGPSTRVQIGEIRGDFVRIRTRGITGWAEVKSF
jgi:hypothetical protein